MKRLFLFFCIALCAGSAMSEEKTISPTVCGITVGKTTNKDIVIRFIKVVINDEYVLDAISLHNDEKSMILLGDFIVEGFHMSLMKVAFHNDTAYEISFHEKNYQIDSWPYYKDFVHNMQNKYSNFKEGKYGFDFITDSIVQFSKADDYTNLLFSASPNHVCYQLTNIHIQDQILYSTWADDILGKTGPNYDPKNKVTAVAGVDFGLQRTNVEELFKRRGRFLKSEGSLTYFSNVDFAGRNYSHAILYFQYDETKKTQVFAAVQFEKIFYQWQKEEAEMMYKDVCKSFNSKYTNGMIVRDEAENKFMAFGMIEDNYPEGKVPIIVSLDFDLSRGGDKYYYVTVGYFEGRMTHVTSDDL